MGQQSVIQLQVQLDDQKIPESIHWLAADGGAPVPAEAKAMLLSLWDVKEQAAMRIDLWTRKMRVDEMNDFFFQTLMTLADTYERATHQKALADEIRNFSTGLQKKMLESMQQKNS